MITMYDVILLLSRTEKIVFELGDSIDLVDCCYRAYVRYSDLHNQVLLSDQFVYCDMKELIEKLEKSLNNKLLLHKSITDDVGYLYNEYYQDESRFFLAKVDGDVTWVGYRYELWQAYEDEKRFITWIYNDAVNSIVFEITPFYPYLFCDPEDEPNYIAYDQWIKSYKPYVKKILPREVAQKWLEQARYIVKQIDSNIARWKKEENK